MTLRFKGDIIITDPCYIIRGSNELTDDDWAACNYGENMQALGIKTYLTRGTIYGDWSCTTFNSQTKDQHFDLSYHIPRRTMRYKVSLNMELDTSLEEALQFALELERFEKARLIEVRWGRESWVAMFERRMTVEKLLGKKENLQ
jgi:hypothetical protein